MKRNNVFWTVLIVLAYFIMGTATSQAPRNMQRPVYNRGPLNINDSKHIVYFDNFNTNKNVWQEGRFSDAEYYFNQGMYFMQGLDKNTFASQNIIIGKPLEQGKDWMYETHFTIQEKNTEGTAYILWGKKGFDFHCLGYTQKDNLVELYYGKRVKGEWAGKTVPIKNFIPQNKKVILTVHKHNGNLFFYLNKALIVSSPVESFFGDEIGIAIGGKITTAFDEVSVKQLSFLQSESQYATNRNKKQYNKQDKDVIPMTYLGSKFFMPVRLNSTIDAFFTFDQWTADVVVSEAMAEKIIDSKTITDWIGEQGYSFKNGSKAPSSRFIISELKIGERSVQNVECMIVPTVTADVLIGPSVLRKFGNYILDTENKVLVFED